MSDRTQNILALILLIGIGVSLGGYMIWRGSVIDDIVLHPEKYDIQFHDEI